LEAEDLADPFERVSFDHPDETYGKHDGFQVDNIRKLTEDDNDE